MPAISLARKSSSEAEPASSPSLHSAYGDEASQENSKLIITDLMIDDVPFAMLDSVLKSDISEEMPHYTQKITIPAKVKKF